MVSTQNKLQYVCVCVYVRDNEGICHPNPVWLTDVFLIVFGKQWRSMAQGSTIKKKNISGFEYKEISRYHSDYALLMAFVDGK